MGDHTSILALIEQRFFPLNNEAQRTSLTLRDQNANTLEDMFNFSQSPSLYTAVPGVAPLPVSDCTP